MTNKTTEFEATVISPDADYLWSNAANWSNGVPVNGDSVILAVTNYGDDDIAGLSLAKLTEGNELVIGADLAVSQDVIDGDSPTTVRAGATVTIGTITNDFGLLGGFVAGGSGSTFVDQSATDQGEYFSVAYGGKVEIFAVPASTSTFNYQELSANGMEVAGGTIAFKSLAATNAMLLSLVHPGDVLELPGTSVSAVSFGASSLRVTTDLGTYAFTNVTYDAATAGYTAAVDAVTGLVAITFNDTNEFQRDVAAASGALAGDYLWSNAANWTDGLPADGGGFTVGAVGYDDIAALRLVDLTLDKTGYEPKIFVTGGTLAIADLLETGSDGYALLEADATDAGAPVSVTLDQNDSHGALFEANGAGARFVDQTLASAIAGSYAVDNGGLVEIANTPLATDAFSYLSQGIFAFDAPAADNLSLLEGVAPGDVLEVPGTSVTSLTLGADSLSVTTDAGTYAFASVVYAAPVARYVAAYDSSTGLEAITFRGVDTFQDKQVAASGPDSGYDLWSNAANWSEGLPIDGDSVNLDPVLGGLSVDDLAGLTLPTLTLSNFAGSNGTLHADVFVTGGDLTVGSLAGASGTALTVDFDLLSSSTDSLSNPVKVTLGSVTGAGQIFTARGSESTFLDQSVTDPGATYRVVYGGFTELAAAPSSASSFQYVAGGTYAFANPAATNAAALTGVSPGEVLELPGTSVSAVIFGTHSLTVTTNTGTYAFTNVSFGQRTFGYTAALPDAYTAAPDPTTGLVAITFNEPDVFSDNVTATSGPLTGDYLWSNAANWSRGVPPADGDSVTSSVPGYDDISGLMLTALSQATTGSTEITTELTVGSVINDGVLRVDDQGVLKITGSLTGSGVLHADPSTVELDGPVGVDQTVDLIGAGNTLILGDPQDFKATINGFTADDVIDLENFSSSDIISKSFVDNILTLVESGGSIALTFANSSDPSIADFAVVPGTGTEITAPSAPCFAAGTHINTPCGDVPVEDLAIGDLVHTEFTGTAPICWIGQRHIDCRHHPQPERVWPVRIAAGAFGSNMPGRALWLSPDHAVYLQGVLIPIKRLINGTSIMQVRADEVTYHHIELPRHDVLRAEGLPAESFLDMRDGSNYAKRHGPTRLYTDYSARMWEAFGCAPLIVTGPELAAARALVGRLAAVRAAA